MIALYKPENTLEAASKTGRPTKTPQRQERILVRESFNDCFKYAASISRDFSDRTKKISRKTVSRRLKAAGLQDRLPVYNP